MRLQNECKQNTGEYQIKQTGAITEVKPINGHCYAYMHHACELPNGNRGKKTSKIIGKTLPEKGFIPNRDYHLYAGLELQDDITVLEYRQHKLIRIIAANVYESLKMCFLAYRASQEFVCAHQIYIS